MAVHHSSKVNKGVRFSLPALERKITNEFQPIDKREFDGWLDPKGNFYQTRCHITWASEDIKYENKELYKAYRKWFRQRKCLSSETAVEFLMKYHGWWKRSSIANSKLWLGEMPATTAQRRYINNDMGERQDNGYFEKGY